MGSNPFLGLKQVDLKQSRIALLKQSVLGESRIRKKDAARSAGEVFSFEPLCMSATQLGVQMKSPQTFSGLRAFSGQGGRIRTWDLLLPKQALKSSYYSMNKT